MRLEENKVSNWFNKKVQQQLVLQVCVDQSNVDSTLVGSQHVFKIINVTLEVLLSDPVTDAGPRAIRGMLGAASNEFAITIARSCTTLKREFQAAKVEFGLFGYGFYQRLQDSSQIADFVLERADLFVVVLQVANGGVELDAGRQAGRCKPKHGACDAERIGHGIGDGRGGGQRMKSERWMMRGFK